MTIDLIYLWVDGNDSSWLKKKNSIIDQSFDETEANCRSRFIENNELKYSLRSVAKNIPWVNTIYIVTDKQVPSWLDINHPKIKIIDHKDILPEAARPSFNSCVIEYFIYKIPGLSEYFLYANDDTFVNANLTPSFFFKNNLPIIRMKYNPLIKIKLWLKKFFNLNVGTYRMSIKNAYELIDKKYGIFYPASPHHNIDAYLKSDYKAVVEEVFKDEIQVNFKNRFRNNNDIQRVIFNYYSLVKKRGFLTYINRKESCRIRVHYKDYQKYIDRYNPKLFCLNDSEHATENERTRIEPFLENLFPEKASFEL